MHDGLDKQSMKNQNISQVERYISNLSFTSAYHHWKLIMRSVFLVMVIVDHFICRAHGVDYFSMEGLHTSFFAMAIWVLFMMEMILRLSPSKLESGGCQKQFQSMYRPGQGKPIAGTAKSGRKLVALVWVLLNLPFLILFKTGIIGQSWLMIIAMIYAVCDMICILYFCPFQTWIMKNRCCTNCYIYNWDYAMMFTPLLFVGSWYSLSLAGLSILVLLVWEYRLFRYPERFSAATNLSLSCSNCTEKLCKSKKQLQNFIVLLEREYRIKDIRKQIGIDNRYDRDE